MVDDFLGTMASLLPSLASSDEEDQEDLIQEEDEQDDDEIEDKLDESFEFGGILGEDGGLSSVFPPSVNLVSRSYSEAMSALPTPKANSVGRLDVSSLIAAKRQEIVRTKHQQPTLPSTSKSKKNQKNSHEDDDVIEEDENDQNDTSDQEKGDVDDDDKNSDELDEESVDEQDDDDDHENMDEDVLKVRSGKDVGANDENDDNDDDDDDEGEEEAAKVKLFFDHDAGKQQQVDSQDIQLFSQLSLSRPLLRGVAAMGFVKPTPIQAAVIPLALAGRDVCASAVTGSGKTAAFLLPVLERMLHRTAGRIQGIILTPTRELAAQCWGMMTTLAQFTSPPLRAALIVGGSKNLQAQAAELRSRPDLVIATPGRLLDHVTNSQGVSIDEVEFLVLDEADRLLDMGFQDEVHEVVKSCPIQRQTLLFSATMNTKVDDLIKLSLKRPVRIHISNNIKSQSASNSKKEKSARDVEVAPRLEQEFVRVRNSSEGINRQAMLLALLSRTFPKQTIVFFDTKVTAHRLMILCGLCGIKCAELHGNLTQPQRLRALEDFRKGLVDVLLATDLAARGLDIDRVETVINFEMPSQVETYVHRIGRTARAGRGGRSCTLIGESRRHLMKEIIKDAEAKKSGKDKSKMSESKANGSSTTFETGAIRSRTIPAAVVAHFAAKIESLESHVREVLDAEEVARMDRLAEMEAIKAENIIQHSHEIKARPAREWFLSNQQKSNHTKETKEAAAEKQRLIAEKAGTGVHRMTRKKRRTREAMEAMKQGAEAAKNAELEQDNDDSSPSTKKKVAGLVNTKAIARQHKRAVEMKSKLAAEKSEHDRDLEREEKAGTKKRKSQHAVGDSSLFDEEKVAYSKKPKKENASEQSVAKSSYHFVGYDPEKKLGKKRGHHSFKSKKRFKRR